MYVFVAANLLAPNFGLAIWILIVFLLLLFILRRFAWGPITAALDEREKTIQRSIQQAEVALAEARRIQQDNESARRQAEQEAQRILREARDTAERLRAEEIERTKTLIRQEEARASEALERQKQAALEELRSEVADLAIGAAGRILKENMDGARQQRLVQDFIKELPS